MAFSFGGIGKNSGFYMHETIKTLPQKPVVDTPKKPFVIYANTKKPSNLINIFKISVPEEISLSILQQLNLRDLETFCCVSKAWNKIGSHPYLAKNLIFNEFAFGPSHWNTYYGENTISEEVAANAFLLLPDNINEILKSFSLVFPGARIMDTHVLTWIPKALNEQVFNIDLISQLLIGLPGLNAIKSGWVLMTKRVIPESINKSYTIQKRLLQNLNKSGLTDYAVPTLAETVVCIYAEYLRSKRRLFSDDPISYTRCQYEGNLARIGCFSESGIGISDDDYDNPYLGLAVLWRFPDIDPWVLI